jgi:hypothetical protein
MTFNISSLVADDFCSIVCIILNDFIRNTLTSHNCGKQLSKYTKDYCHLQTTLWEMLAIFFA